MWGISWLVEWLLASEDAVCSMELVNHAAAGANLHKYKCLVRARLIYNVLTPFTDRTAVTPCGLAGASYWLRAFRTSCITRLQPHLTHSYPVQPNHSLTLFTSTLYNHHSLTLNHCHPLQPNHSLILLISTLYSPITASSNSFPPSTTQSQSRLNSLPPCTIESQLHLNVAQTLRYGSDRLEWKNIRLICLSGRWQKDHSFL
jgi:hypothetical protein